MALLNKIKQRDIKMTNEITINCPIDTLHHNISLIDNHLINYSYISFLLIFSIS